MLKLVLADFRDKTQHEEVKEISLERRYQTSLRYSIYYMKAQVWFSKTLGTPIWKKKSNNHDKNILFLFLVFLV